MRKGIFITSRTDSSRLPNKALLKILDRHVIEHIINRAKLVHGIDEVVLCTTERTIDNEIVSIAERCGIKYFRGSLEDKLDRWLGAARQFNIDFFVTFDGDDLFCDPALIEMAVSQMEAGDYDFMKAPDGLACGGFTYAIKVAALEKVCQIKDTADTEMMWVYFEETGLFSLTELEVKEPVYFGENRRLTLDYPEDYEFFSTVFEKLQCSNNDVPLKEIMVFLNNNPEIVKINAFRQADFLANQKRRTKLVLK